MTESLTRANARALVAALLLTSLPAFLATRVGPAISALAGEIDAGGSYFSWIDPGLLYILMPVAVLGALILFMSPGLVGVLALGRGSDLWSWLLEGFVVSLVSISLATTVVQTALRRPLVGAPFIVLVLLLTAVAGILLYMRTARSRPTPWPLANRRARLILASLVGVPLVFLVALTPKFFWESFNGDGTHAFLAARLLLFNPLPFFSPEAGVIAQWPGINGLTVPYVPSWFVRLFGQTEAGVRLPLVLFIPILFAGIAALAEAGRKTELTSRALALMWASIISFTLVMSYSATYDPYAADIAMPANHDFLVMIFCFGAMAAFVNRDTPWLVLWTLLALMTSPGSLPIFGLLLAAWFVSARPLPWRTGIGYGLGLLGCLVILSVVPVVLGALGVQMVGSEHSPVALFLSKFEYLAVLDFERFLWVAVPCGIYPVVGLFGWRGWDTITRALILLTLALFAMYYIIAVLSLHYFVAAMLIPLVVFWRKYGARRMGRIPLAACWAGAAAAIWLALPSGTGIYVAGRTIGESIDVSAVEGFATMNPKALRMTRELKELFPIGARPDVPSEAYGGSPLTWMYYASQESAAGTPKNYALVPPGTEPPAGATEVINNDIAAIYVYDLDKWESDRTLQPENSRGKEIYAVSRDVLFYRGSASDRPGFFRPAAVVARFLGRGRP